MMKFQVGDIVEGNGAASAMYDITSTGSILEVIKYNPEDDDDIVLRDGYFMGRVIYSPRGFAGHEYVVSEEYFDFKESVIQENE